MPAIGYALASEDWAGSELVRLAVRAEESGFEFTLISDHFHPWIDAQGESPFVWSVIGGIAQVTERLRLGTGVTCPTMRTHPAIVAHAAATCAELMPGRFLLGVGTGENLNEHVLGDRWPAPDERLEMLEEAIEIMRLLWQGGERTHRGRHYTVDHARLYTLPDEPPPIAVAAAQPNAAELAGRLGDGLINTSPDQEIVEAFRRAGGQGKHCYGMIHVCWGDDEDVALDTAHRLWPNLAIEGELSRELARPAHFEDASQMVTSEKVAEMVPCGPDPERHLEVIRKYEEAGFDNIWVHQIGPDQEGFFRSFERELAPRLGEVGAGLADAAAD
jgi:coenzyme F420-dependent glucose-6-phosphate dehydrogenase